jgi:hypothetical protein
MQSLPRRDKPFPRRCPECGKMEVCLAVISYDAQVNHDGRLYSFHIPRLHVNKCGGCGDVFFDNLTDDEISQALRDHLNLLSPQDIRKGIRSRGLNQKQFGKAIGVAQETISRWLSDTHIQSRAMDILMRMFFKYGGLSTPSLTCLPADDSDAACLAESVFMNPQTGIVTLDQTIDCVPRSVARWNTQGLEFGTMTTEHAPETDETCLVSETAENNLALAA